MPQFVFPEKEDVDDVLFEDIVANLPKPTVVGGTKRAFKQMCFDVDLRSYFK